MTAKATQFGKRTFSSWLIESSGALPIKRRMDYAYPGEIDNSDVMNKLYQVLVRVKESSAHPRALTLLGIGARRCCVFISRGHESLPPGTFSP